MIPIDASCGDLTSAFGCGVKKIVDSLLGPGYVVETI
jgi:hypothetical protein